VLNEARTYGRIMGSRGGCGPGEELERCAGYEAMCIANFLRPSRKGPSPRPVIPVDNTIPLAHRK
jgi:hypothetical protein